MGISLGYKNGIRELQQIRIKRIKDKNKNFQIKG